MLSGSDLKTYFKLSQIDIISSWLRSTYVKSSLGQAKINQI